MVPGMYHCGGGPGANQFGGSGQTTWPGDPQRDMLWSLIHWVEQDEAPETITAARIEGGAEQFSRPLCRFPASLDPRGACTADRVLDDMLRQ